MGITVGVSLEISLHTAHVKCYIVHTSAIQEPSKALLVQLPEVSWSEVTLSSHE